MLHVISTQTDETADMLFQFMDEMNVLISYCMLFWHYNLLLYRVAQKISHHQFFKKSY